MARSTKAKSPKAPKAKSASRAKGLITAANLAGIGSLETFTIIRELHDRLAQQGKDVTAGARVAMTKAAPMEAAAAADLNTPWVTVARGELGQRDYPGPSTTILASWNTSRPPANRPTPTRRAGAPPSSIGACARRASPEPTMPLPARGSHMDKLSAIRAPVVSSSCGGSRLVRGKAMSASSTAGTSATAFDYSPATRAAAWTGMKSA